MTFTVGINLPWIDGQYDHDFGSLALINSDETHIPAVDEIKVFLREQCLNHKEYKNWKKK